MQNVSANRSEMPKILIFETERGRICKRQDNYNDLQKMTSFLGVRGSWALFMTKQWPWGGWVIKFGNFDDVINGSSLKKWTAQPAWVQLLKFSDFRSCPITIAINLNFRTWPNKFLPLGQTIYFMKMTCAYKPGSSWNHLLSIDKANNFTCNC